MKKTGFFGGCFNPPTIAHLELAKLAIKNFKLDKVVFVPMNDFYEKDELLPAYHRLNMLELLTKDEKNLEITDFELKSNKKIYAIEAFEYIDKNFEGKKIFIMGSDNYIKMKNWKDSDKFEKFNYIILDRLHEIEKSKNVELVSNNKFSGISSSKVRQLLQEGQEVNEFLTVDVCQYIKSNKLYLKED